MFGKSLNDVKRGLMYTLNRNGESNDPCGTP